MLACAGAKLGTSACTTTNSSVSTSRSCAVSRNTRARSSRSKATWKIWSPPASRACSRRANASIRRAACVQVVRVLPRARRGDRRGAPERVPAAPRVRAAESGRSARPRRRADGRAARGRRGGGAPARDAERSLRAIDGILGSRRRRVLHGSRQRERRRPTSATPSTALLARERQDRVRRALDALPEPERTLLQGHYFKAAASTRSRRSSACPSRGRAACTRARSTACASCSRVTARERRRAGTRCGSRRISRSSCPARRA